MAELKTDYRNHLQSENRFLLGIEAGFHDKVYKAIHCGVKRDYSAAKNVCSGKELL